MINSYRQRVVSLENESIGAKRVSRECFIVVTLDTKNQPTPMNFCQIGSLNASMVYSCEVFKTAILI
ncbi:JAB domain-containing protein [Sporolactobacillus shoreicorticis]|nr:JAB domain-containing protein [Sporolactobacillus shoreicorticis]